MDFLTVFFIAIGLAMDAFAVSISCGLATKSHMFRNALITGLMFGAFQFGMTIAGWFTGLLFKSFIEPIDHWIAFALLLFIGIKMIRESFDPESCEINFMTPKVLTTLAIATSIDALAVGISFSTLNVKILGPSVIIGLIAFAFSFGGIYLGKSIKNVLKVEKGFEIFGGTILIFIGFRILLSHLNIF